MIVVSTPKWDGAVRTVERTLRERGALAAIRATRRFGMSPALRGEVLYASSGIWVLKSRLHVAVYRGPGSDAGEPGSVEDHGVVSRKVITTAGVNYLVDAWQNSVELENLKFHGLGTGTGAEASGDTALGTELTTQYQTDNTRPTGTLTEGASANIFRTVGTITVDASVSGQEHGIFSQAATGGGTLWDRSLTGTQTLSSGDSLQATYDMTASAGG